MASLWERAANSNLTWGSRQVGRGMHIDKSQSQSQPPTLPHTSTMHCTSCATMSVARPGGDWLQLLQEMRKETLQGLGRGTGTGTGHRDWNHWAATRAHTAETHTITKYCAYHKFTIPSRNCTRYSHLRSGGISEEREDGTQARTVSADTTTPRPTCRHHHRLSLLAALSILCN